MRKNYYLVVPDVQSYGFEPEKTSEGALFSCGIRKKRKIQLQRGRRDTFFDENIQLSHQPSSNDLLCSSFNR